jgi:hypothetical protein
VLVVDGAVSTFAGCKMGSSKSSGLQVGKGGRALLKDCKMEGNKGADTWVFEGGHVDLLGCHSEGNTNGLYVSDVGSSATAKDCTFHTSSQRRVDITGEAIFDSCVVVEEGATADLASCSMNGEQGCLGIAVSAAGSRVTAKACLLQGSQCNIRVSFGATAEFVGCEVRDATYNGMQLTGAGTTATARECVFVGNKLVQVLVTDGAVADLATCFFSTAHIAQCGLSVVGAGSEANATACMFEGAALGDVLAAAGSSTTSATSATALVTSTTVPVSSNASTYVLLRTGAATAMALAASGDAMQLPAAVSFSPPPLSDGEIHLSVIVREEGLATLDRCQLVGNAVVWVEAGSTVRMHLNIVAGLPLKRIYADSGSHLFVRGAGEGHNDWVPLAEAVRLQQ